MSKQDNKSEDNNRDKDTNIDLNQIDIPDGLNIQSSYVRQLEDLERIFNRIGFKTQLRVFKNLQRNFKASDRLYNIDRLSQLNSSLNLVFDNQQNIIETFNRHLKPINNLEAITQSLSPSIKLNDSQSALNHAIEEQKRILSQFSNHFQNLDSLKFDVFKSLDIYYDKRVFNNNLIETIDRLFKNTNQDNLEESIDEISSVAEDVIESTKHAIKDSSKLENSDEEIVVLFKGLDINTTIGFIALLLSFVAILMNKTSSDKVLAKLNEVSNNLGEIAKTADEASSRLEKRLDGDESTLIAKKESVIRLEPSADSDSVGIVLKDQVIGFIKSASRWNNIYYLDHQKGNYNIGWIYKGNVKKVGQN